MRQRALQALLLVHAIEQTDLAGDAVSLDDRVQAGREAAGGRSLSAASNAPAQINGDTERFLVRRAEALLARLRVRAMQKAAAAKEDAGGRSRRAGFQKIAARRHDFFSHGSCWAHTVGSVQACSSALMAELGEIVDRG